MQPLKISSKLIPIFVLALVAWATFPLFTLTARGAAEGKGASKLMKPITSYEDVASLKDGDLIAMACPKCKTVTLTSISTEKGHIKTATPTEEHLCPGCEQKFVVVGEGKAKHDKVTHVCKKCGSTDAFCCVWKKDAELTKATEPK